MKLSTLQAFVAEIEAQTPRTTPEFTSAVTGFFSDATITASTKVMAMAWLGSFVDAVRSKQAQPVTTPPPVPVADQDQDEKPIL